MMPSVASRMCFEILDRLRRVRSWRPAGRWSRRRAAARAPGACRRRTSGRRPRRSRCRGCAAVWMSSMSLAVSAGADRPPPWRLMPLLLDSSPPWRTTQWISRAVDLLDIDDDAAVVEQQHVAGGDVVDQFGVVEADAAAVTELAFGVEDEGLAILQQHLAAGELADADLRSLQVGHDADGAAAALRISSRSVSTRARWSSAVPCEKLRRTTSMPASTRLSSIFRAATRRARAWRQSLLYVF